MVTSDSTVRVATLIPAARPSTAIRAPTSGTPVASTTMSSGRPPRSSIAVERDAAAALDRLGGLVDVVGRVGRDPGLAEGVLGTLLLYVEDGGERDPRHPEELGGEAGPHLSGADQADAQRPTCLV